MIVLIEEGHFLTIVINQMYLFRSRARCRVFCNLYVFDAAFLQLIIILTKGSHLLGRVSFIVSDLTARDEKTFGQIFVHVLLLTIS